MLIAQSLINRHYYADIEFMALFAAVFGDVSRGEGSILYDDLLIAELTD